MAIYDVDSVMESDMDTDDILDNMLEACDQMMSAIDESDAMQRHYGTTSKQYKKFYDGEPITDKVYGSKNALGKMGVKSTAKSMAKMNSGKYDKITQKLIDASEKRIKKAVPEYEGLDDRYKEELSLRGKASQRAATGALMSKAAKAGYDVKGEFEKAKAKEAKKKAIKETCLNILSVIDEL